VRPVSPCTANGNVARRAGNLPLRGVQGDRRHPCKRVYRALFLRPLCIFAATFRLLGFSELHLNSILFLVFPFYSRPRENPRNLFRVLTRIAAKAAPAIRALVLSPLVRFTVGVPLHARRYFFAAPPFGPNLVSGEKAPSGRIDARSNERPRRRSAFCSQIFRCFVSQANPFRSFSSA
jgi:hypothetical protein